MQVSARQLSALVLMLASPLVCAKTSTANESGQNQTSANIEQDLIGGVITSRTVTVLGWDFFQYFSSIWRALHGDTGYSLSVHERPTARWGSEVWIQYGQARVFHTFLPPARSATKAVSANAVDIAYENVVNINVQRELYSDIDLAPEEM